MVVERWWWQRGGGGREVVVVVGLWYVGGGRKVVEVVKREVVLHERCRCCWRQGGRIYCEKIVTVNFRYLLSVTI